MAKKEKCPHCLGTGQVPNHACIGASMKALRKVTLATLAERMALSVCHLSLLENGKRKWTPGLVTLYRKNCR